MREAVEEAFWNFVDQKWRNALNIAAAEPPAWGAGSVGRAAPPDGARREPAKGSKAGAAAVHVAGSTGSSTARGTAAEHAYSKT
jgi:hypothetical protein